MAELSKEAWRELLRARLETRREGREEAAEQVARRLLELPEIRAAEHIFACLSFGLELDTWGLVERLRRLGKRIYVPRAEPRDGSLHVHPYPCALRTLAFGLQQPPRGTPELAPDEIDTTLDVALVLGLGFDRRGYRLGYGSGYFDRFLAGRPFPAIALAFDEQLVEYLPAEPHDIPMHAIVTESGLVYS